MTLAKQKADELIEKYLNVKYLDGYCWTTMYEAIECAIIAVEEILSICTQSKFIEYWTEVLTELKSKQ